uniref:Uncharacterized protein n=1 Tax=Rhizophora mucronata TaxID=61149 RepID=A0A2P2R1S6_RHIMU
MLTLSALRVCIYTRIESWKVNYNFYPQHKMAEMKT